MIVLPTWLKAGVDQPVLPKLPRMRQAPENLANAMPSAAARKCKSHFLRSVLHSQPSIMQGFLGDLAELEPKSTIPGR
jgi:hypothetical protein